MRLPKPTNEQQVLFDLLKGKIPPDLKGVDTQKLFDLFQRHRLFPIAQGMVKILSDSEKIKWKKAIQSGSLRTLQLTKTLKDVLQLLVKEGIEAIPLKGPVLAQLLYGDLGQKHMWDLDLLVLNGDILRAVDVLKGAGFTPHIPSGDLKPQQWRYYFRHQYDVAMKDSEFRIVVELHAGIAYPGFLNPKEKNLLNDIQEVEIAGFQLPFLSNESTFLYLAIHGTHHLYFRLFWLRDFAMALERWELDHRFIFDQAKLLGVERMLGVSLSLAHSYFGVKPPEVWHKYLNDQSSLMKQLENRCHKVIGHPKFLSRRNRLNVLIFTMTLKPGWRHKWVSITTVFHRWYIKKFLLK